MSNATIKYDFQYFPPSIYEEYTFSYGGGHLLKSEFIYNPHPTNRRYLFYYDLVDGVIVEIGEKRLNRVLRDNQKLVENVDVPVSRDLEHLTDIGMQAAVLERRLDVEIDMFNERFLASRFNAQLEKECSSIVAASVDSPAKLRKGNTKSKFLRSKESEISYNNIKYNGLSRFKSSMSFAPHSTQLDKHPFGIAVDYEDLEANIESYTDQKMQDLENDLELQETDKEIALYGSDERLLDKVATHVNYESIEHKQLDRMPYSISFNGREITELSQTSRKIDKAESNIRLSGVARHFNDDSSDIQLDIFGRFIHVGESEAKLKETLSISSTIEKSVGNNESEVGLNKTGDAKSIKNNKKDVTELGDSKDVSGDSLFDIYVNSDYQIKSGLGEPDAFVNTGALLDSSASHDSNLNIEGNLELSREGMATGINFDNTFEWLRVDTEWINTMVESNEAVMRKSKAKSVFEAKSVLPVAKDIVREIDIEKDKRAKIHKRLWFIKQYGTIDYKILPNEDFKYPMELGTMVHKPAGNYHYSYISRYDTLDVEGKMAYEISLYDKNYNLMGEYVMPYIDNGKYSQGIIEVGFEVVGNSDGSSTVKYDIVIHQSKEVSHMIIRQPRDVKGKPVLYVATEKTLAEKHPLPMGHDLGLKEIPVHIPIMVEFINVLLLFWSKFYVAFTGYTGSMAVYGMVNMVYEWLSLESSELAAGDSIEDYNRCYRWLRWEAEKVYHRAKHDPDLNGNYWIEELLFEMIEYMEMHHFNILPEFEDVGIMDEYRDIFKDPSFDMEFVLDKMKGVRNRVIDKNKRLND